MSDTISGNWRAVKKALFVREIVGLQIFVSIKETNDYNTHIA